MSRTERLLELIDLLRRYRAPVAGQRLADELGVSLRTLYRDIGTLQDQGAEIVGSPGRGYQLRPGFLLPPMMFTDEEIEALVLGARWVSVRGDPRLGESAQRALAKITAVLPSDAQERANDASLVVPRRLGDAESREPLDRLGARIREAIRSEVRVELTYRDLNDRVSERVIWPIALAYFERVELVAAWCELRGAFRSFRVDGIQRFFLRGDHYPRPKDDLLLDWRQEQGLPEPIP